MGHHLVVDEPWQKRLVLHIRLAVQIGQHRCHTLFVDVQETQIRPLAGDVGLCGLLYRDIVDTSLDVDGRLQLQPLGRIDVFELDVVVYYLLYSLNHRLTKGTNRFARDLHTRVRIGQFCFGHWMDV